MYTYIYIYMYTCILVCIYTYAYALWTYRIRSPCYQSLFLYFTVWPSFGFLRSAEKMEEEPPLTESELHQILEEQPYMILMASDSRWELWKMGGEKADQWSVAGCLCFAVDVANAQDVAVEVQDGCGRGAMRIMRFFSLKLMYSIWPGKWWLEDYRFLLGCLVSWQLSDTLLSDPSDPWNHGKHQKSIDLDDHRRTSKQNKSNAMNEGTHLSPLYQNRNPSSNQKVLAKIPLKDATTRLPGVVGTICL